MTTEKITELILTVLGAGIGSGIVVSLIDWFKRNRSEKKARRVSALSSQIQNLYGPLQFFSSQNASLFELNNKFHEAGEVKYYGKDIRTIREEVDTFFDIANTYIHLAVRNNENILDILRNNYAYIDPDDNEIFQRFCVDYERLKTERDESGKLKTPIEIYFHVGEIFFMRPEFNNRVKEKFNSKKQELESLSK